jgi:2-polyprenyl-6-hydroxyphenyl methylase/3-demethylubiquinone-9 3-methyltransferase
MVGDRVIAVGPAAIAGVIRSGIRQRPWVIRRRGGAMVVVVSRLEGMQRSDKIVAKKAKNEQKIAERQWRVPIHVSARPVEACELREVLRTHDHRICSFASQDWAERKRLAGEGSSMGGYYNEKLAAEALRRCYEIAPPRVREYLAAEIQFVREELDAAGARRVLELGCGYGRFLRELAAPDRWLVGIDTSHSSLKLGRRLFDCVEGGGSARQATPPCGLLAMDAGRLGFGDASFDAVVCIQNGISALKVPPEVLMCGAVRVTRRDGLAIFSSYAECFWDERLEWFRLQAQHGLLGEIDEDVTGNGEIVCKDGFRATTFAPEQFAVLLRRLRLVGDIMEVDGSSVFCIIRCCARGES